MILQKGQRRSARQGIRKINVLMCLAGLTQEFRAVGKDSFPLTGRGLEVVVYTFH